MPTPQTDQSPAPARSSGSKLSKAAAAAKRKAAQPAPATTEDAVELLIADHRAVSAMFDEFERIKDGQDEDRKLELAEDICLALIVHTTIEEEIFYPAFRKATKDEEIVEESIVEHQAAKELIAIIERMEPEEELFDARVHVLSEEIEHHVKEEEEKMFPEARQAKGLDLKALGAELAARKRALFEELGGAA
jgi:hypothetical protein